MSGPSAADAIIAAGRERLAQLRADHDRAIYEQVRAGEPLMIFGVRYVPDRGTSQADRDEV